LLKINSITCCTLVYTYYTQHFLHLIFNINIYLHEIYYYYFIYNLIQITSSSRLLVIHSTQPSRISIPHSSSSHRVHVLLVQCLQNRVHVVIVCFYCVSISLPQRQDDFLPCTFYNRKHSSAKTFFSEILSSPLPKIPWHQTRN